MDLKVADVAELLSIPEETVAQWVDSGEIPAYRINEQYLFNRTEVEDWVIQRRRASQNPTSAFGMEGDEAAPRAGAMQYSLFRALHRGQVLHAVEGTTKAEIIRNTVSQMGDQLEIDIDNVSALLLDREKLMSTAINSGIAVPHTRDFLLNERYDVVTVVFPKKPVDWEALDGEPVQALFFLFACEDRRHLHLLAKIAHLVSDKNFLALLKKQPTKQALLAHVREWEATIAKPLLT